MYVAFRLSLSLSLGPAFTYDYLSVRLFVFKCCRNLNESIKVWCNIGGEFKCKSCRNGSQKCHGKPFSLSF